MTRASERSVEMETLPGGEDVLLRPVLRGMISFESLKSGAVSLGDVMLLNDALDVEAENLERLYRARDHGG